MKKTSIRPLLAVASMLFGMFFGAGNLIFPAFLGQMSGRAVWLAGAGFLITGVGPVSYTHLPSLKFSLSFTLSR